MTRKGNLRQSDRDAIARYTEKTYKVISVKLRKDLDMDIIEDLEQAQRDGISYRAFIRSLYDKSKN